MSVDLKAKLLLNAFNMFIFVYYLITKKRTMNLTFSIAAFTSLIQITADVSLTDLRYADDPATLDLLFDHLRTEFLDNLEKLQSKVGE